MLNVMFEFRPEQCSERSLALVRCKTEEWGVTPAQAVARLLDELAQRRDREPIRRTQEDLAAGS